MNLSQYEGKYIRLKDVYGQTFIGRASHGNYEFLMHEYGGDEDGIFIEDWLIYNSQIESIEEIVPHGTAELWTERLILRRYTMEDAEPLYRRLGQDPAMSQYSGWNPYETLEMAQETVRRFIDSYDDEHSYSWVMDVDDVLVGTIGAYDYMFDPVSNSDQIEVGYSVVQAWQGRGLATEALTKVLEYLTENEGISALLPGAPRIIPDRGECLKNQGCNSFTLKKTASRPAERPTISCFTNTKQRGKRENLICWYLLERCSSVSSFHLLSSSF